MKYSDEKTAEKLSGIRGYPRVNRAAVREMHRQVGDLEIDETGLARRGLLVRHLVLPHGLAGTREVVRFLAGEVSPDTYLNIMAQYRPGYQAFSLPQLARPLNEAEFAEAISLARRQGLNRRDRETARLPRLTPR
jgi:putative pyruvate formate lyase activating enzyme